MADKNNVSCFNCHWLKNQSGSSHYICPRMPDFSFGWKNSMDWEEVADECNLFIPKQDDYSPECNQFMAWITKETVWPEEHEMIAKHDEWLKSVSGKDK